MRYIKEYDSLRFVAVFFVIVGHAFPHCSWIHGIPLGMIGVSFFFVLSGKLITGILLHERDNQHTTIGQKLKVFYVRRSLRIFPAYYLFLLLNYFLGSEDLQQHSIWFLTYTQNILFFKTSAFAGALSPTWTLAVEEQFYLLWPFCVLLVKPKYFKQVVVAAIILSPVSRVLTVMICQYFGQPSAFNLRLMPSNLICLASGGLLSLLEYEKHPFIKRLLDIRILFGLLLFFIPVLLLKKNGFLDSIIIQIAIAAVSIWILNYIANAPSKKGFAFLTNPVTMYLGRISYGMYLYHTIAFTSTYTLVPMLIGLYGSSDMQHFLVEFAALVLFSSVSWFFFEKPLNNLKKYFKY